MTAPDYVRKGSTLNNRESVRFYKTLENGHVVVVEKEWANSATDLEAINFWGELSDAVNARKDPEQNVRNATIGRSDAAKIRKDAETAILNDEKIRMQKVSPVFYSNAEHAVEGIKQEYELPVRL